MENLDEPARNEALKELFSSISEKEPFKIPHECSLYFTIIRIGTFEACGGIPPRFFYRLGNYKIFACG